MQNLISFYNHLYLLTIFFLLSSILCGQDKDEQLENEFKSANKIVHITADSSTYDETFGESYRILEVYKKENGDKLIKINRTILPINLSPDFPYKFSEKYDGETKFVSIKGLKHFFIYDIMKDSLSELIRPIFDHENGVDFQTGNLENLKISDDGKILTGYGLDLGDFKYDLTNLMKPKQIE